MSVFLTFYDGVDNIGGNKILLEDNGTALLLDFGTNFKVEGMYFDEYLFPRLIFGFTDLLALGILPPLHGGYRSDLEYPGIWEKYSSHPSYKKIEIQGILLSHAHWDHCGYLPYLRADIPVYTSLTTSLILKALQDTSTGSRLQEVCYITPRELKDGLLRTTDYRRIPGEQRPFMVWERQGLKDAAQAFWARCESSRRLVSRPLISWREETEVGGIRLRFWPMDHSIPGAGAFGLKTSAGWIIYTGDFRLHGKQRELSRKFMQEAANLKPVVLICEGTHPRTERPVTEEEVLNNCRKVIPRASTLVVADFGPRNVERLLSFLQIASEKGRRLVLTPKDIHLLEALYVSGEPGVPDPYSERDIVLYIRPKAQRARWEENLLERFRKKAQDRIVEAKDIRRDPGSYILCFSYYDFHALLDLEVRGGIYIYSSSEAFDEEMLIDQQRVKNWIDFLGFELYGNLGREREKSGFHASGHVHGPGLEEMVETIQPDILIPIHTEDKEFFQRFKGICRVVFPNKGQTLAVG